MKNLIKLFLITIIFVSCGVQIDYTDVKKSQLFCAKHIGIKYIKIHNDWPGNIDVICLDGQSKRLSKIELCINEPLQDADYSVFELLTLAETHGNIKTAHD